jgi:hypothetical protein
VEAHVPLLQALADPARFQLSCLLAKDPSTASRLIERSELSQSLGSPQLCILRPTGLPSFIGHAGRRCRR